MLMSERIIPAIGEPPTPPSFDLVPRSCPATSGWVCWLLSTSLLFHALFLSPIQTHKTASTIFWIDNQKIAGLRREILYNIQPPNPTQYWSHWRSWGCTNSSPGGPRRSSRLDLSRDWSSKGCHASTCSGILWSQGSQEVVTPGAARGFHL